MSDLSDLFQLSAPWWHFVVRGVIMYILVMVLIRASGKRAVGQFTTFDLVLLILIGNAVQNGINGGDNSMTGALIMAVTLVALNYAVAWVTARNRRMEIWVEGVPVVLARDGKVYESVLRRELVSKNDFEEALRMSGIDSMANVRLALLEIDGHISMVSMDDNKPRRAKLK